MRCCLHHQQLTLYIAYLKIHSTPIARLCKQEINQEIEMISHHCLDYLIVCVVHIDSKYATKVNLPSTKMSSSIL